MEKESGFTIIEAVISIAILLLIAGVILSSISGYFRAASLSDNTMLVNSQNSRIMSEVTDDLMQTSRNFTGRYAPLIDEENSELRFRRVRGFSLPKERATYEEKYACYWLDSADNVLYRRYRDLAGNLLDTPEPEVIGAFVTAFSTSIDYCTCSVIITVTTSRGKSELNEDATTTRTIIVTPFNIE